MQAGSVCKPPQATPTLVRRSPHGYRKDMTTPDSTLSAPADAGRARAEVQRQGRIVKMDPNRASGKWLVAPIQLIPVAR